MTTFHLIVGSQQGNTEYIADELAEALNQLGHEALVHEQPEYEAIPQQDCWWIVCTSTFGAGDFPDNIQPFVTALTQNKPNLSAINYAVVAVGDSSYDTFCHSGIEINSVLADLGAKKQVDPLMIDILTDPNAEETAVNWLKNWLK